METEVSKAVTGLGRLTVIENWGLAEINKQRELSADMRDRPGWLSD